MGIFSRLLRIGKGRVNQSVDAIEEANFETTLRQTIRDMEKELDRVVRGSAEALSHHNRLESEYARNQRQAEDWEAKATKALEAGKEDLAVKCLQKKKEFDTKVSELEQAVNQSRAAKEKLIHQRDELRKRIDKARRDADTLIARKNAARAQRKVAQALSGVDQGNNAFATLDRFQQNVEKEEARATAYEQLASGGADDELEQELASLDDTSVDADLAALKAKLGRS